MAYIVNCYGVARRRACGLVKQTRSTDYYHSVKDRRHDLRGTTREIAKRACGTDTSGIHVLLKLEG